MADPSPGIHRGRGSEDQNSSFATLPADLAVHLLDLAPPPLSYSRAPPLPPVLTVGRTRKLTVIIIAWYDLEVWAIDHTNGLSQSPI